MTHLETLGTLALLRQTEALLAPICDDGRWQWCPFCQSGAAEPHPPTCPAVAHLAEVRAVLKEKTP